MKKEEKAGFFLKFRTILYTVEEATTAVCAVLEDSTHVRMDRVGHIVV